MAQRKFSARFTLSDHVAMIGLFGVVASVALWALLSWADSVMRASQLVDELFTPSAPQAVVRLLAVILVLASTLLIQTLYGRRQRAEQELQSAQAHVHQMHERSPEAIVSIDAQHRVLYANPAAEALAGKGASALLGITCHEGLFSRASVCERCPVPTVFATGEVAHCTTVDRTLGEKRWLEQVFYPVLDSEGRVMSVVESTRDTTELRRAQKAMQRLAYYDPLTELPNRTLFRDRLSTALAQARRRTEMVAVIFVDLDGFKAINDTLGHQVGDELLKAVGERLRGMLREEDTVARQGGDEFTVVARVQDRAAAGLVAERILESVSRRFVVDGYQLGVQASIGIALYPGDGERDVDLIRNADAAMYRAKDLGTNSYRFYTPDMSQAAQGRQAFETEMRRAIENAEFELYYQPQVDVRDGRFVGVEALLRWNHPTRGLLAPGEFIEPAEQAGLIGEIGRWALRTACEQAQRWLAEGLEFGRITVNLSAREFVERDVAESVASTLAATGLDPHMLELEVTETIAMYSGEQISAVLHALREMGVRVAIDDFGTGYSSMSYLKRYPVQTLKIAQDFMCDVHIDPQSAAIASMIIELCRQLGLDVIAEGVENESQLEFLRTRGCYVIQGHLFSAPLSSRDLTEMMRRRNLKPSSASARRAPAADLVVPEGV